MRGSHIIGIAGHVDHGKTTLVRCLTGVDTDRKPEEKRRGMSIEAGVAPLELPSGRRAAVIDVPGHTDFLKNTIRGLHRVDLGVLVVAADDGVMPQTREHLDILSFFDAAAGCVVLSKTDLVDEDTAGLAELEVRELLQGTVMEGCPFYRFSALNPGLAGEIARGLEESLADLPSRKPEPPFRLWIDQVRNLPGHGTVVSGTVSSGVLRPGDELELLPAGLPCRARSLESHGAAVDEACAGERVGVNLPRVSLKEIARGMALATPGAFVPAAFLNVSLRVLARSSCGVRDRQAFRFYSGTAMARARIVLMEGASLAPGEAGLAQLRLDQPAALRPQDPFVITPLNRNTVVAGGRVLDLTREKFRPVKAAAVLPFLKALERRDAEGCLEAAAAASPGRPLSAKDLARRTGLPPARFEALISSRVQKKEWVYLRGRGALSAAWMADLKARIPAAVEAVVRREPLKKSVVLAELCAELETPADPAVVQAAVDELCREGRIVGRHGGVHLPDADKALGADREALAAELLAYARQSGLTPFSADTYWKLTSRRHAKDEIRRMLNYLFAQNRLVRLNDQRFLSLEALEEIKARVARTAAGRGFVTVGDCKEILGYGRWGGTHVLDHLDRIGFTQRREDRHYLRGGAAP
jgi:selenocysteine-specific elongation factor